LSSYGAVFYGQFSQHFFEKKKSAKFSKQDSKLSKTDLHALC
jgi:hypothetical protein